MLGKAFVAMVLAVVMAIATMTPSRADQAAKTRNIILGAAAAVAGIILYNNYEHKKAAASTIVGYTQDGGTVYADGHIVCPNGQSVYANNNGQYGYNGYCSNAGYYGNGNYNGGYYGQYGYGNDQDGDGD